MYNTFTPHEKLVKARIDFIHQDSVFLGNLSLRLKLVEAEWLPTAAVDGFHLYYNPNFIDRLDLDECKFVVAHEVMHCVYEHILRRGGRDARLFNIAGDYVINYELKELNVGKFISQEKMSDPELLKLWKEKAKKEYDKWMKESAGEPGILYDPRFKGMITEEVYDILFEEEQESGQQQQGGFDSHMDADGSDGDGDGEGQEADDCETCGGSGIDPNDDGSGDQQGQGEGGEGDQEGQGHAHGGGKPCPDCGGTGKDTSGKSGRIPISKEDLDRLPDDIKKAVMDAAKVAEASEGAGRIPAGVKRLINEWTDSKMDWREYLNNVIQSQFKSDYTWMRQSRKSMSSGYYLPGMDNDEQVSCDISIDTSGSMSDQMLKDILGEVRGIMEQFMDFKIRVWCFDTVTYTVHEYTMENVDEMDEFELEGGGGTMFECNWEMMRNEEILPDQLILCTDGYPCGSWGEEDYCETVFLVHGEGKKASVEAPFGTTVYYEEAAKEAA